MRESPAIWQPQRRDLESFLCVFTPPPSLPPNGERSFSPLLLNLRVRRDARPKGRPHRSEQNAITIEPSYRSTRVWESFCAARLLRETYFFLATRWMRWKRRRPPDREMLGWKAQTLTRRLLQEYEVRLDGCEICESETLLPWDIATRFRGNTIKWETLTTSQSPQHGLGC